jgi:acetyl-CoA C-acetyltransferase|tara:strand:- start:2492 stop:3688 length:1197 start_codon:yes stop_codon:yes gene_type:complete
MLAKVAILAASATEVGRLTPEEDSELRDGLEHDILAQVVAQALDEAGLQRQQIDSAIFTANPPTTRQLGFATYMSAQLGLQCRGLVTEVSQLGITGGVAFDVAAAQIQLGQADFALALGVVVQSNGKIQQAMENGIRAVGDVNFQSPFGVPPIGWYALDATRYLHDHGATRAELAEVAVKSRYNAILNPLAQFRKTLTVDDVLAQRPIVEPLGLFEVPARADGAICLVLCNEDNAKASGKPYVTLEGRGFYHEGFHQIGDQVTDMTAFPAAGIACEQALSQAGKILADIDVAELYAPCTITEVLVSEAMGFFPRGDGVRALLDGETHLHGSRPINTSGGCLSRGHPPQITALYGLLELREQLLGLAGERQIKNAERGIHTCELGNYNAALTHILERSS